MHLTYSDIAWLLSLLLTAVVFYRGGYADGWQARKRAEYRKLYGG